MSWYAILISKIIGRLVTNLVCMPYYKSYLEDLSNIDSFDLECATNIRIPILENN